MSARPFPTGLPLVDALRSCMLQNVPRNSTAGACSSLPYDAADLISDLYEALEFADSQLDELINRHYGGDIPCSDEEAAGFEKIERTFAKARGESA